MTDAYEGVTICGMTAAAPFDYTSIASTADRLIARFGTSIVLSRAARDVDLDPWDQSQGPAATDAAQSITGLFGIRQRLKRDPPTGGGSLGQISVPERPEARWVFQTDATIPEEVNTDWILTANSRAYQVFLVEPVQPGTLLLLYFATTSL